LPNGQLSRFPDEKHSGSSSGDCFISAGSDLIFLSHCFYLEAKKLLNEHAEVSDCSHFEIDEFHRKRLELLLLRTPAAPAGAKEHAASYSNYDRNRFHPVFFIRKTRELTVLAI